VQATVDACDQAATYVAATASSTPGPDINPSVQNSAKSMGDDEVNISTVAVIGPYISTKEKAKLREPPWAEPRNIVMLPRNQSRTPSRAARILVGPEDSIGEDNDDGSSEPDRQRESDSDAESFSARGEVDNEDELSEADHVEDVEYEKLLWEQFGMSYEEPNVLEDERDFINDYEEVGVRGSFVKSKAFIVSDVEEDFASDSDHIYESS
jgi:hypothetical protein